MFHTKLEGTFGSQAHRRKDVREGFFFPPREDAFFFQDPAGGKKVPELIGLGKCLLGIWGGELAQAGTLGVFHSFLRGVLDGRR